MKILGSKVGFKTQDEIEEFIKDTVVKRKKAIIITLNTEMIIAAEKDREFQIIINKADLAVAESSGLKIAYNFLRFREQPFLLKAFYLIASGIKTMFKNKPPLVPGVDLVVVTAKLCAKNGFKLLLVGGVENRAEKAAQKLKEVNQGLLIEGIYGGSKEGKDEKRIVQQINKVRPQVLFLAFGHGWQEKWLTKNLADLDVNVAVGVGGAFDYISGEVKRAPKFIRNLGLEWAFRLLRQPWRLKRQLALVKFLYSILLKKT